MKQPERKHILPDEFCNGPWKPIIGYNGYYEINEYGAVMSISRFVPFTNRWGQRITRKTKRRMLPWYITQVGYARVMLSKKHETGVKKYSVHRLVMQSFLKKKSDLPQINHEDGNKLNNHYSNLVYCTQSYNQRHAYETGLNIPAKSWDNNNSIPVVMYDLNGLEINRFGSLCEAQRVTNIPRVSISQSCKDNKVGIPKHSVKFRYLNK